MNKSVKAKQEKELIMNELFVDINNKKCILDTYLDNCKKVKNEYQNLSDISKKFLKQSMSKLIAEYSNGRALFFRKYNYEKILNTYLENKYNVCDIELSMFSSEKDEKNVKEKNKQKPQEKHFVEQKNKIVNVLEKTLFKPKSINEIAEKYNTTPQNVRAIIRIYKKQCRYCLYNKCSFEKVTSSVCSLQYSECIYHNEFIVRMEKHSARNMQKQKNDNSSVVAENKNDDEMSTSQQIDMFGKNKRQYSKFLRKEYGFGTNKLREICKSFQNECKYLNTDVILSCKLNDRPCTVFYSDCPYNKKFMEKLRENRKIKLKENVETLAKIYGINKQKVDEVIEKYRKQCTYYTEGRCNSDKIASSLCTLQYEECILHKQFLANLENIQCMQKEYFINELIKEYKSECSYYKNGKCGYNEILSSFCTVKHSACIYHNEFIKRVKNYSVEEFVKSEKKKSSEVAAKAEREIEKSKPILPEIGLKDFVVRRNVFKCMHNKHKIDNVTAIINIDDNGKKQQIEIFAGYCSQCKVYFILDSTYQNLKKRGMILCRITDEKNYMKGTYVNGMKLAQESILMQYGYTVSQTEGLSALRRQKILAVIIDNRIMSKSEIISYLDFFISQRSSMRNMEIAISKWEVDREFVENYRSGEYTQFGVSAIYRRL